MLGISSRRSGLEKVGRTDEGCFAYFRPMSRCGIAELLPR
jgi:hypothetical protein